MVGLGRALFLKATTAAFFSGGLDIWPDPGTPAPSQIRVLIATDRREAEPPRADGDLFIFDGKRWRGTPSVAHLPDGRMALIATLGIEDYLYGVLPIEASPGWPPTALAAHAIVSRTFALSRRTLSRPYDVVMSQSDQRFGGVEAESPATNAAVDATRGAVLTYAGGNASVFYASCCGGHTADAAEVWGHTALPYLRGVADPYCSAAPDFRWQRTLARDRLQAVLAAHVAGEITGITLGPADAGGRPLSVDVVAGDARATLSMATFRALVGADVVRSTWVRSIEIDHADVHIAGAGRGHGVGLCQWGARALGVAGTSPNDILAFYFPGTRIATIDSGGR